MLDRLERLLIAFMREGEVLLPIKTDIPVGPPCAVKEGGKAWKLDSAERDVGRVEGGDLG